MILHYGVLDKFIEPLIQKINNDFDPLDHIFLFGGNKKKYISKEYKNFVHLQSRLQLFSIISHMNKADKIILHGLWDIKMTYLLYLQKWLLKKTYWSIWGGDLHRAINNREKISFEIKAQNYVVKNVGHIIAFLKGDYDLARNKLNSKGKFHQCVMYQNNLQFIFDNISIENSSLNILVGNSATESNFHFDIFEKLRKYKDYNIKIYCPLSYGDKEYGANVISEGKSIFGEKFIPMLEFIPLNEYTKFLAKIDIGIYNQTRQQALANKIVLIGMGKKVFVNPKATDWEFYKQLGIEVFDINNFIILENENYYNNENKLAVKKYFTEENYSEKLMKIFYS